LPCQAGISADLCEAIALQYSDTGRVARPVNDIPDHAYPDRMQPEVACGDRLSYLRMLTYVARRSDVTWAAPMGMIQPVSMGRSAAKSSSLSL
jgi:hypothetical protein